MTKKEMVTVLVHYAIENELLNNESINALSVRLKVNPAGVRRILEDRALLMNKVKEWGLQDLIDWLNENDQTTQDENNKGALQKRKHRREQRGDIHT